MFYIFVFHYFIYALRARYSDVNSIYEWLSRLLQMANHKIILLMRSQLHFVACRRREIFDIWCDLVWENIKIKNKNLKNKKISKKNKNS